MIVLLFPKVHATAKYLPLLQNLSLKAPYESESNFQASLFGSIDGNSANFSHFLSFFITSWLSSFACISPIYPSLSIFDENFMSPISFSHGALEICFLSMISVCNWQNYISISKKELNFSFPSQFNSKSTSGVRCPSGLLNLVELSALYLYLYN